MQRHESCFCLDVPNVSSSQEAASLSKKTREHRMSDSTSRRRSAALAIAVTALLAQAAANATTDGTEQGDPLTQIIVTATRRAESVQDVPINISALSGETIAELGVGNLTELSRSVPGLFIRDQGGRGANQIVVRGLNADPVASSEAINNDGGGTVATYVGEIPFYIDMARGHRTRGSPARTARDAVRRRNTRRRSALHPATTAARGDVFRAARIELRARAERWLRRQRRHYGKPTDLRNPRVSCVGGLRRRPWLHRLQLSRARAGPVGSRAGFQRSCGCGGEPLA